MIRGAAAAAGGEAARAAAQAAVESGESAVDAIIAGFLAAAGESPGVLLAPAVAVIGGVGVGARAFDGRNAQPGKGAPRPRGYVDASSIPAAARFPVPRALAMLALLHSYLGRSKLRDLARPGALVAEKAGASRRAELIRSVGDRGVLALRSRDVERVLLLHGGSVAGGALTSVDLDEVRPVEQDARVTALDAGSSVLDAPWAPASAPCVAEMIVACDARGIIAALAYAPSREGIHIDELEIIVGADAVPVQRGVTRLAPGTPLPAPVPIAIVTRSGGSWAALGLYDLPSIDVSSLDHLSAGLAMETALEEVRTRAGGSRLVAVVRDPRDARAITLP